MKKIKFEDLPSENTPITSANLNNMQNNIEESVVVVSSTEPVTKEKVWLQKSINIFDGKIELGTISPTNGELAPSTSRTRSVNFMKVKPNTTYTIIKEIGDNRWVMGYTKDKIGITDGKEKAYPSALIHTQTKVTQFTTTATTHYIKWYDTQSTNLNEKVMIYEGTSPQNYEPYKPSKILTKNTDGTFSEFINVEDIPKVASTEPQSNIWFQKGKNLFDKKDILNAPNNEKYPTAKEITLKVEPNTQYICSSNIPKIQPATIYFNGLTKENGIFIDEPKIGMSNEKGELKVYIFSDRNYYQDILNGKYYLQIENGNVATTFKPYISKKILTKNSNGVFEEFYNEEEAIPKTITTSNGTAIKFADGTMIQYGVRKNINFNINVSTTGGFVEGGWTLTMPVSFKDINYYASTTIENTVSIPMHISTVENRNVDAMIINLFSPVKYQGTHNVRWFAIGRWK